MGERVRLAVSNSWEKEPKALKGARQRKAIHCGRGRRGLQEIMAPEKLGRDSDGGLQVRWGLCPHGRCENSPKHEHTDGFASADRGRGVHRAFRPGPVQSTEQGCGHPPSGHWPLPPVVANTVIPQLMRRLCLPRFWKKKRSPQHSSGWTFQP